MIINHLLIFFSIIHVLTIFTFFIGLFRKKNPESSDLPFISIVVALKNEEDNLIETRCYETRNKIIERLLDAQINQHKPHIVQNTKIKYIRRGR